MTDSVGKEAGRRGCPAQPQSLGGWAPRPREPHFLGCFHLPDPAGPLPGPVSLVLTWACIHQGSSLCGVLGTQARGSSLLKPCRNTRRGHLG